MLSFDIIEYFHTKLSRNGISIVPTDQTDFLQVVWFCRMTDALSEISAYYMFNWTGGHLTLEWFRLLRQMTNFYDRWEKPVYATFLCSVIKLNKQAII